MVINVEDVLTVGGSIGVCVLFIVILWRGLNTNSMMHQKGKKNKSSNAGQATSTSAEGNTTKTE